MVVKFISIFEFQYHQMLKSLYPFFYIIIKFAFYNVPIFIVESIFFIKLIASLVFLTSISSETSILSKYSIYTKIHLKSCINYLSSYESFSKNVLK